MNLVQNLEVASLQARLLKSNWPPLHSTCYKSSFTDRWKYIQYNYSLRTSFFYSRSSVTLLLMFIIIRCLLPYRFGDAQVQSSVMPHYKSSQPSRARDIDSNCQAQNMPFEAWKLCLLSVLCSISIAMGVFLSYQPDFWRNLFFGCQMNSFDWSEVSSSFGAIHSDPSPEITADKKKSGWVGHCRGQSFHSSLRRPELILETHISSL